MTAVSVVPPFPVFTDINGLPLEDGYLWIGQAGQDPQNFPITVYWDDALTQAVVQPIRTTGGYPVNAGVKTRFFAGTDYSIRVRNENGTLVYESLSDNAFAGGGGSVVTNATGNGVQTIFSVPSTPTAIYINGVYQNQSSYTVGASAVTFSAPPPITSTIEFVF